MTVPVPLEELRHELDRRGTLVYLVTVGDNGRPHCVAVRIGWDGDQLEVRTGTTSGRNAGLRRDVTMLAPPQPWRVGSPIGSAGEAAGADTNSYSLIVDGDVIATEPAHEGGSVVHIRPVHAVFHRPASAPDGAPVHDCMPLADGSAAAGDPG